jgi:acyl-coenzyme A thioesterase PaaI-like protein
MNTRTILQKARNSPFYLWLLNMGLNRMIPFNKPHGFAIKDLAETEITTLLPYKRGNFNHIKGLHACALATLSEFTTGVLLISHLDPAQYRIILQRLEMDYHYQGKTDARAHFVLDHAWMEEHIYQPLKSADSTVVVCEIKIYDAAQHLLTTGRVHWQVKEWTKVRTKL